MKKIFLILAVSSLIALAGCGGGGNDNAVVAPPVANQALDGIWNGTFTSAVLGGTIAAYMVITPANAMRYVTSQGVQGAGAVIISGGAFSGAITAFTPAGAFFPNGSSIGALTAIGTGTAKGTLTGTYSGAGDNGTFTFTYDPIYDRGASLATIAGTWAGTFISVGTGAIVTANISAGGIITGSDTAGCIYNGSLSIIDPLKNVYTSTMIQTVCTPAITLTGLATVTDNPALLPLTNNVLNFALSNATSHVAGYLTR